MIVGFDAGGKTIPTGTNEILEIIFQANENFNGGTIKIYNVKFSGNGDNGYHKDNNFSDLELEVTPSSDVSSSVDESFRNNDNISIEIFNLSGIKVATANSLLEICIAPGVYIVKRGNEYSKILIR